MSARFRARAPGPVSGQLCSAPGGRAGHDGAGFLLPFGRRPSLLGHPVPPGASAPLTIGLPRRDGSADPSGVSMFRTRETRPGPGALYTPGTAVPARPRVRPVTAACRLATAGPCHPGATTRPGMFSLTRHQQGFTGVRPSRPFPSPVAPGRNGDPWAFPWASHPAEQDPAAHAGAGTGLRHWPGVTSSPSATSLDALTHTSDLMSQRTCEVQLCSTIGETGT